MSDRTESESIRSFTSAGVFPSKLLRQKVTDASGRILPVHVQFYPTNACDLNCDFCSCADRKNGQRIATADAVQMLEMLHLMGTRSITISGGGEPTLHPGLNVIIETAKDLGIKVGLVSHGGWLSSKLKAHGITWCRVSRSDVMDQFASYFLNLREAVHRFPEIDWAFSYVLTAKPQWEKLEEVVFFAWENGFTHVRVVSDLLDLDLVPSMEDVARRLNGKPGADLVIPQGRKAFTPGREKCRISLLKPVIAADGYVYPCCGAQYALAGTPKDVPEAMRLCYWKEMPNVWERAAMFNGFWCVRCYYDDYNQALSVIQEPLRHEEFV